MHFKTLALGAAALMAATSLAFAAEPASIKMMKMGADTILTDANDMTIYTYDKDEPGVTNCYDKCAVNWPPVLASATDAPVDDWTIVDRTDGTKQWAYKGMPVYLWIKDTKAGDITGDGVGGVWHLIKE